MFRWLVNVALLVLPIAVTLGVLFGIQTQREAAGKPPLFVDNGVKKEQYCQKSYGIHPLSKGQEYTLNPNQWGWTEGKEGALCLDVTTFNNRTYATNTTAPAFSVTWQYPPDNQKAPVHAFPNIKVENVLPVKLGTLEKIKLDFEWTMGMGNKTHTKTDKAELTKYNVNTNVAMDMFIDADRATSEKSDKAKYEVMVWFAQIGPASHAIGQDKGSVGTKSINGTKFDLFVDQNQQKQWVLTWLADSTTEKFHGDLSPLLEEVLTSGKENYPTKSDYMGYLSLGTEAYSADKNVTFSVPRLAIDIQTS